MTFGEIALAKFLLLWPSRCKSHGIYLIRFYSAKLYTSSCPPGPFSKLRLYLSQGSHLWLTWPRCKNGWIAIQRIGGDIYSDIFVQAIITFSLVLLLSGWLLLVGLIFVDICLYLLLYHDEEKGDDRQEDGKAGQLEQLVLPPPLLLKLPSLLLHLTKMGHMFKG